MALADIDQIIQRMEDAVSVVVHSEHATSKVAACLFHPTQGTLPAIAANERPPVLKPHYKWVDRLGVSSQFVHSELAAIARYKGNLNQTHICITDPFCPNCAKNMAEAGVQTIYIDHKGFQKDFIERREGEFKSMSMLIAERAGMSVYMINRKERTLTPILEQVVTLQQAPAGIEMFDVTDGMTLESALDTFRHRLGTKEAWTIAFAKERMGGVFGMLALEALPAGFTPADFLSRAGSDTGKYRFPVDPLTRLMIGARRMGVSIVDDRIGSAQVPSSRSLVNALEFGLKSLILASDLPDHDPSGVKTLEDLQKKFILQASHI